jgi:hypothetical protein
MDQTLKYWRNFYAKELAHHVHNVQGMFKNGKEYFIRIVKSKGTGVVKCEDSLVKAAVQAQAHYDNKMNYEITIIPKLQPSARKSKATLSRSSMGSMGSMQTLASRMIAVQSGGSYPPDMNPEGCENLQLHLGVDPITAIYYSEPVVSALTMCGSIGILYHSTPEQSEEIIRYMSEHIYPVGIRPETVINDACMAGRLRPSFDQFRFIFDQLYGPASTGFNLIIRESGLEVTPESWEDGSYEIRILLGHLHNHAYAHNGIEAPEDITELTGLLGGISKVTAHVVHSMLHTYDSLYMHDRTSRSWSAAMRYLGEIITQLIPDPAERRCYFRLLNKNADRFLVKVGDGVPTTYRAPYAITDEALPDKERQYSHSLESLVEPLALQIMMHTPMEQTGTTQLLPNVD